MSEQPLQFERAEFASGGAQVSCSICQQQVVQSYYAIGGQIMCSLCREKRERAMDGWGGGRFLRASFAGLAAAIAGAAVWYGVRISTGYEIGIIAIAVGFAVGKAVHWGAHGKGGWLYQLLAVFLTYTSIVTNYVPDIVKGVAEGGTVTPFTYIVAFVVAYGAPFFMGLQNIIGDIIIAIGLWEAWKLNKRVDAEITGPYTVTPATTPAANG